MRDCLQTHYEIIRKASDMLYRLFDGKKETHSEVVEKAKLVLSIVSSGLVASPDYNDILNETIDQYEIEVGIKTYDPYVIAKDRQSSFWLYKVKPTIPHSFFDRYKLYLRQDGFSLKAIANIESSCEKILSHCANPKCPSQHEQKRGLVVGDVQSGKTANYLGLINMAYDYGYKIVVLLAGTTNSLRVQTQKRTDKGVIGAKSDSIGNSIEYIGVGLNNSEHYAVPFTNQGNDFARFIQRNLNATISDFRKPVVLVVKKNKSILESVIERLQPALKDYDSNSILIIDDEADNASISTSRPGNDPTAINKCIRGIFNKFPIATYVGYTATPFANIFIQPYDEDNNFLDLFPADFIIQLNAPDNYFGGRKMFSEGDVLLRPLRLLDEEEDRFLPVIHGKDDDYPGLPDSLKEAILCFVINNVVRTIRGQKYKHRSMMINISRYNNMQQKIMDAVSDYLEKLNNIIEQDSYKPVNEFVMNSEMAKLYSLYTEDEFYKPIREGSEDYEAIFWTQIQAGLYEEIKQIQVVVINSRNGKMTRGRNERFDYEMYEEQGARVIAIGGMVLSRGLTLEGLMVSYYSRNAGTYDTLLQMCRWFGYRPRYEDLCRVYLSQLNIDRFCDVLEAVEDLKEQFAEMDRQGKKPIDFGLMVRESPASLETSMLIDARKKMLVTARNKMYNTDVIEYHLNYGGVYADTSKLSKDPAKNKHNRKAFDSFAKSIAFKWENNRYWAESVYKYEVATFIRSLKIPYVNKKFDTEGLAEYIENSDVFPYWDVVIAKGDSTTITSFMGVTGLNAVLRSFHVTGSSDPYIRIGGANNRVLEPGIFNTGLWLTKREIDTILIEKNEKETSGKVYTELTATDYLTIRSKKRPVPILVIYPIELQTKATIPEKKANKDGVTELVAMKEELKETFEGEPLLAFAVGFPGVASKVMVKYRANLVKLDELVKDLETDDEDEGADDYDD